MTQSIWIAAASSVSSGLLVLIVSFYFSYRRERRKEKFDVLGRIMGSRHGLTEKGDSDAKARFFEALNTVFVAFHDSAPVLGALQDCKKHTQRSADNVTQLIRRMSEDLGINVSALDDNFFNTPFVSGT